MQAIEPIPFASPLGRSLRAMLIGWRASLQALADGEASDPARPAALELLQQVEAMLGDAPPTVGNTFLSPSPPSLFDSEELEQPGAEGKEPDLLGTWRERPEWKSHLGSPEVATGEGVSERLWLLTNRLPPGIAETWREDWRLREGKRRGPVKTIAGPFDEALVPGTEMRTDGPLDARLTTHAASPLSQRLAVVVSAMLRYFEADTTLRHCLPSLSRFGFHPLHEGHLGRYVKVLVDRLDRLAEADRSDEGAALARAWVDLDEAIQSVVHASAAHLQSTFARIARASRDTLGAVRDRVLATGTNVHLQILTGPYSAVRVHTEPDRDLETSGPFSPGEVVHCTRVLSRVNGQTSPGRVIYCGRSS